MVEMTGVTAMLKNAPPKSLLIVDGSGRSPSTNDDMSSARAVL